MNNIVGVDAYGDPLVHLGLRAAVGVSPYEKIEIFISKIIRILPLKRRN
jgi:hypothetical protein